MWAALGDWFAPPTAAWWYRPLAATLLGVLAASAALLCWPIRVTPLTAVERSRAARGGWARAAPAVLIVVTALTWLAAAACLSLGPRVPTVVKLGPAGWDAPPPAPHAGRRLIDAQSMVEAILARATRDAGTPDDAADWFVATPERRARLARLCRDQLEGTAPPPAEGPAGASPRPARAVPKWVRVSVEMTVVLGLIARENVVCVVLRVDPGDLVAWDHARRLHETARTRWAVEADPDARPVRVLQLFDGRISTQGEVRCQALVQGPPGASASLEMTIVGPTGDPLERFSQAVTLHKPLERVDLHRLKTGSLPAAGRLTIAAECGVCVTPLRLEGAPAPRVEVQGGGADDLVRAWAKVAATKTLDLDAALQARGLPRLDLIAGPITDEAAVVQIRDDALFVLPPDRPAPTGMLLTQPLAETDTADVASFGMHVSRTDGRSAPADEWISIGLRHPAGPPSATPRTAPGQRVLAGGALMNRPLEAGRLVSKSPPPREVPVLEVGRDGVREFLAYRFGLASQGLLWPASGGPPAGYEPTRARAFFVSLAAAIERVQHAGREPGPPGAGPEPAPLATASDLDRVAELGRRPADAAALSAIAASLLFLLIQAGRWRSS